MIINFVQRYNQLKMIAVTVLGLVAAFAPHFKEVQPTLIALGVTPNVLAFFTTMLALVATYYTNPKKTTAEAVPSGSVALTITPAADAPTPAPKE